MCTEIDKNSSTENDLNRPVQCVHDKKVEHKGDAKVGSQLIVWKIIQ